MLRVRDVARVELGAAERWTPRRRLNGQPAVGHRRSISRPAPMRCRPRPRVPQTLDELQHALPGRACKAQRRLRHHDLRERHDPRGDQDAGRGLRPGRDRGVPVPRQHARHDHPGGRRAGQPDRHLRRPAARSAIRPTPSRCWRWCWRSASSSTTPSSWSRTSSA